MKSDYRIRAQKFIAQVYPFIRDCEYIEDYYYGINEFNRRYSNRKVMISTGSVRIAFITSDYVVKFDYDCHEAKRFGGCEDEMEFYQYAKQEGYEYLFAEIIPYQYLDIIFYIMPRIHGIGCKKSCDHYVQDFLSEDELDFVESTLWDMHDQNYGWKNNHPVIIDYACNILFARRTQGY